MNKTTRKLLRYNNYPLLLDIDLNYIPSNAMWYTDNYDHYVGYTIKRTLERNDIAYVITREHVATLEAYHIRYHSTLRYGYAPSLTLAESVRYRSNAEDRSTAVIYAIQSIKLQQAAYSLSRAFSSTWFGY